MRWAPGEVAVHEGTDRHATNASATVLWKKCDDTVNEMRQKEKHLEIRLSVERKLYDGYESLQADLKKSLVGARWWLWGLAKGLHTPCKPRQECL